MTAVPGARGCAIASLLVALVFAGAADAREKTDIIRLTNGDRITGEIIQLEYGQLKVKTDSIGTIYVEWPSVAAVESEYEFLVEWIGGRRAYGRLRTLDGALVVSDRSGEQSVPLAAVVVAGQADDDFWQRVSGSASIGANYASSTDTGAGSATLDATYRSRTLVAGLSASYNRTSDSNGDSSNRWRVAYQHALVRPKARYLLGLASMEANDELGLQGRLQLGGALMWRFHERADSIANTYAGLVLNQEWETDGSGSTSSLEAVLGLNWQIYRFANPETTLSSTFEVYPNLTDSGRVRARTDVSLKRKFYGDFTFQLQFYDDYDSRPPSADAVTNDYGFTTSLGYTF
jgi:hypothetical protein